MTEKPKTFEEALDAVMAEMRAIMLEKRRKRGHENISEQGIKGVVDRMSLDKLARIRKDVESADLAVRLTARGVPRQQIEAMGLSYSFGGDSFEDDLLDTGNYSIIAVMLMRGLWELPSSS